MKLCKCFRSEKQENLTGAAHFFKTSMLDQNQLADQNVLKKKKNQFLKLKSHFNAKLEPLLKSNVQRSTAVMEIKCQKQQFNKPTLISQQQNKLVCSFTVNHKVPVPQMHPGFWLELKVRLSHVDGPGKLLPLGFIVDLFYRYLHVLTPEPTHRTQWLSFILDSSKLANVFQLETVEIKLLVPE